MRWTIAIAAAAFILAPHALAQAPPDDARVATISLLTPLDGTLHVRIEGPEGATERTAVIARNASSFVVVARAALVPEPIDRLELRPPDGWGGASSAGVIVFGQDLRSESRIAGEARVRSVGQGALRAEDAALIARGVAYLAAQHDAPRDILVVRAPRELAGEGYVANDTVVLANDAPVDELARLLARLHQGYRVVEVAPASAAWFREGEERVHAQMALLAAGLRTIAEVDDTFTRARAVADPDAILPQAPAGSTLARQKGLVVVRALDAALRNASGGGVGLADLLHRLDGTTARLDSVAIQEHADVVANASLAVFFERYVYGSEWPPTPGVRDASDVFVGALSLDPDRAAVGEQVLARYEVANRGTQPSELDLVLTLDGAPIQLVPVRLEVGARANASVPVVADAPGDHVVGLGARQAPLHVLSPGRLVLARASTTPDEVRAGEPFTLLVYLENAGEGPARGRIEVHENDRVVQRTTAATVDGLTTDALTLPMRLDEPGLHILEIRLVSEQGSGAIEHGVEVELTGVISNETPTLSLLSVVCVGLVAYWLRGRR